MPDNSPRKQPGRSTGWRTAAALAALALAAGSAAAAPTVVFTATDLPDAAGGDTWRYDFTVSGTAAADESVNLLFSPGVYADLMEADVDPALTVLVTQPDAGLGADGMVQAIFSAALTGPLSFGTSFTWLGTGAPGSVPFEVLDANFSVVDTGRTQPRSVVVDVPEPPMAATVLMLAAAAMVWRRRAAGRG